MSHNSAIVASILKAGAVSHIVTASEDDSRIRYVYFAYGSNIDDNQVKNRTPGAVFMGRGILHGYKLTFCSHSVRWGGGVANIEKDPGSTVYGVLWGFSKLHLSMMDVYEGYPEHYLREIVPVTVLDDVKMSPMSKVASKGTQVPSIVYAMRNPKDYRDVCAASPLYLGQIERGYVKHRLPVSALHAANEEARKHEIGWNKLDDQMDQLKNTRRITHKATAGHIEVTDLVESLRDGGGHPELAPNGDVLLKKNDKETNVLSTKVREIIRILQRDPTRAMKVCIESSTNVPNDRKCVVIKNNSMVEGSWILTTKELVELFEHKDYFPVELQLTSEEHSR